MRNWRNPHDRRDEIDLICRDGSVLVFVEVKARAAGALRPGYHAVDRRKKRVLRRTIEAYLAQLPIKPQTFRLDVVEVVLPGNEGKPAEILHFENIPLLKSILAAEVRQPTRIAACFQSFQNRDNSILHG